MLRGSRSGDSPVRARAEPARSEFQSGPMRGNIRNRIRARGSAAARSWRLRIRSARMPDTPMTSTASREASAMTAESICSRLASSPGDWAASRPTAISCSSATSLRSKGRLASSNLKLETSTRATVTQARTIEGSSPRHCNSSNGRVHQARVRLMPLPGRPDRHRGGRRRGWVRW